MTRDELTTYVLERLGVGSSRTEFVAQIQGHLNRAYVREVIDLGLNMATSTLVFTADEPIVYLPDDWRRSETLRVGKRILVERTYPEHMQLQALESDGALPLTDPSYVVLLPPRRYLMVPAPSTDATEGTLTYHAAPALMTAGTDEPDVIDAEYHDLLGEMVVYRMASNQEDPALSADALQAAALIREQLRLTRSQALGASTTRIRRVKYG